MTEKEDRREAEMIVVLVVARAVGRNPRQARFLLDMKETNLHLQTAAQATATTTVEGAENCLHSIAKKRGNENRKSASERKEKGAPGGGGHFSEVAAMRVRTRVGLAETVEGEPAGRQGVVVPMTRMPRTG